MSGCVRRVVGGLLLLALGAAGWHYRNAWLPKAKQIISAQMPDGGSSGWAPLTLDGAQRAVARIQRLSSRTGPAYVNVDAADFASYVLREALTQLAAVDSAPEALVQDRTLYLRTYVRLGDLGGKESLGPLAQMFSETEPLTIAGTIEPIRPGLAQYRLTEVALKDLKVPQVAISRLVKRWGPAARPDGVATDALPIVLPPYVADLRLGNERVTLYKTVQ